MLRGRIWDNVFTLVAPLRLGDPMPNPVVVHKARTNTVIVDLGEDVSLDTFTSEIRSEPDHLSTLLMTWDVDFETDGTDGRLVLTVDDLITEQITVDSGYMDVKRVTGGQPIPMFDKPLEVIFRGVVTV
jgi:hypothetical protein